jgi:hypothetical protein
MAISKSTKGSKSTKTARPKTAKKTAKAKLISTGITPDQRSHMIAEAAYYRAEQRGFTPEGQVDDWLEAETMVDEMINQASKEGKTLTQ